MYKQMNVLFVYLNCETAVSFHTLRNHSIVSSNVWRPSHDFFWINVAAEIFFWENINLSQNGQNKSK